MILVKCPFVVASIQIFMHYLKHFTVDFYFTISEIKRYLLLNIIVVLYVDTFFPICWISEIFTDLSNIHQRSAELNIVSSEVKSCYYMKLITY